MGTRRRGRELALQMLYQYELAGTEPDTIFTAFEELRQAPSVASEFAMRLVRGVVEHLADIDAHIAAQADNHYVVRKSIRAGRILAVEGFPELPRDVLARPPQTDARVVFLAGQDNKCFLPESQVRSFEYFDRLRPGYHSLMILPGYGHLDVFMGKNAWKDVFPRIILALDTPD